MVFLPILVGASFLVATGAFLFQLDRPHPRDEVLNQRYKSGVNFMATDVIFDLFADLVI